MFGNEIKEMTYVNDPGLWDRRLYCLECGDGALSRLPSSIFVGSHADKHKMDSTADEAENFVVVERGNVKDASFRLATNLTSFEESLRWAAPDWVLDAIQALKDEKAAERERWAATHPHV